MNLYKAVIHNDSFDENGAIIEQERKSLGKDFLKAALFWGFEEVNHYGKDAKQISIDFYRNGEEIFSMYLITYEITVEYGSGIYTDVYIEETCIRTITLN